MNGVLLTMITDGNIKFIWVTVITTDEKLFKGHIRDMTGHVKFLGKIMNRSCFNFTVSLIKKLSVFRHRGLSSKKGNNWNWHCMEKINS